ncbi:type VI secretion system baseplate subunit TssF [Desulfonauticus submarinus]
MLVRDYYQQQLDRLRRLAQEFAKSHPALAPMLSGQSRDPDVERLLEGMAYLTGMLTARLDDSFPEIVHTLIQLCSPQYLRPIPSSTIIQFVPDRSIKDCLMIKAGTEINSIPVEKERCIYRTCIDVLVYPLFISEVERKENIGQDSVIRISFHGMDSYPENLPPYIRLFLRGSFVHTSNLFYILTTKVKKIVFKDENKELSLSPKEIKAPFFSLEKALFPYPKNSFPAFRLFQEYFVLPEKFLFLDIYGWDKWRESGGNPNFEIEFLLDKKTECGRIEEKNFSLFCTPAVNLFKHEAVPIELDHRSFEYKIIPGGQKGSTYSIFSIDKVTGIVQGSVEKKDYFPLEISGTDKVSGTYYQNIRLSPTSGKPELYVSVGYIGKEDLQREILVIDLTCTHGERVNSLQIGDICEETDSSPTLCSFENIITPTPNYYPVIDKDNLWRFMSHYNINIFSLKNASKLREILSLYLDFQIKDTQRFFANKRRIDGILDLKIKQKARLHKGNMLMGHDINIVLSSENFSSYGDMYIFIKILDYFFSYYAAINSYIRLIVKDSKTGEILECPARFGEQLLI